MKKLFSLLLVLVLVPSSFNMVSADTFYGGRSDNGNISVFYTQSVRGSATYTSIYNDALKNWNNISSKVRLNRVHSSENVGTFFFATQNKDNPNTLGYIIPYTKNHLGQIDVNPRGLDDTWYRTDVYIFTNNMDRFGMNYKQKVSNATHEIGHSLKLAHPGQGTERCVELPNGSKSVMNQGIQDIGPQKYDKNDIIYKWGW